MLALPMILAPGGMMLLYSYRRDDVRQRRLVMSHHPLMMISLLNDTSDPFP